MSAILRAAGCNTAGFLFVLFVGVLGSEQARAQAIGSPCVINGMPGTYQQVGFPGNFRILCTSTGGPGGGALYIPGMTGRFQAPDPFFSDVPGSTMDIGGPYGKGGSTTDPNGTTGSFSRPDPQLGYVYTRGSGFGASDSAGAVSGSTQGFRTNEGGFTENGHINLSPSLNLPANERLSLGGAVTYLPSQTVYDNGAGSIRSDLFNFTGGLAFGQASPNASKPGFTGFDGIYSILSARAGYGWATRDDGVTGGTGHYAEKEISGDFRLGGIFTLASMARTKAQNDSTLKLDLSGHIARYHFEDDAFTDSSGFSFGTETLDTWQVGGRARLEYSMLKNGYVLTPFASGTIDQLTGYRHAFGIVSAGDTLFYDQGKTAGGAQVGVDIFNTKSGIYGGVAAFYSGSSDMQSVGGRAYFIIPFDRNALHRVFAGQGVLP
jgi:hypothetical protein